MEKNRLGGTSIFWLMVPTMIHAVLRYFDPHPDPSSILAAIGLEIPVQKWWVAKVTLEKPFHRLPKGTVNNQHQSSETENSNIWIPPRPSNALCMMESFHCILGYLRYVPAFCGILRG